MPRHNHNAKGQIFEVRIRRKSGHIHGIQAEGNNGTHAGGRIKGNVISVRKIQVGDILRDLSRMRLPPPAEPVIGQKERIDTYNPNWTLTDVLFGHQNKK
jgi:hypothetical protein